VNKEQSNVRDYFDGRMRDDPEFREAVDDLESEYEALRSSVIQQLQRKEAREAILQRVSIRDLAYSDIKPIVAAFADQGWNKPATQYERYLREQEAGVRDVFVAFLDGSYAGYVTILWESTYEPFRTARIPEINDFNVMPDYRRQDMGSLLMDEAEARVSNVSDEAGIGVGMGPDYGPAQRLYTKRGYIADGRGLTSHGQHVTPGQHVRVDDDLVLYFTRQL
jgi:GNAT superfamily N-acetyltransferase